MPLLGRFLTLPVYTDVNMTKKIYKNNEKWYNNFESGFVALISVLIVAAVGLGVVLTLLSLGIGNIQTSGELVSAVRSRNFAHSCAEDALANASAGNTPPWSGEISFDGGSCSYTVADDGTENILNIEATGAGAVNKTVIKFNAASSTVTINSWKEVPDFQ